MPLPRGPTICFGHRFEGEDGVVQIPVYPTILTRADWDKSKGTVGRAPNELGVGSAVWNAESAFKNVDWKFLSGVNEKELQVQIGDGEPALLFGLSERIRQQRGFIRATCDSQLALADA